MYYFGFYFVDWPAYKGRKESKCLLACQTEAKDLLKAKTALCALAGEMLAESACICDQTTGAVIDSRPVRFRGISIFECKKIPTNGVVACFDGLGEEPSLGNVLFPHPTESFGYEVHQLEVRDGLYDGKTGIYIGPVFE